MFKTLVAISLLVSSIVFAQDFNIAGKWRGTKGEISMDVFGENQGKTSCRQFDFDFTQNGNQISLVQGYVWCGHAMVYEFVSLDLEVKGTDVYDGSMKIGTLLNNKLMLDYSSDAKKLVFGFEVKGNAMNYSFEEFDGATDVKVTGQLSRK